jgi:PadR family transcriptional regulator PadR
MPGSDLFTGSLDLLILKGLTFGPRHGYAVGRWIRETTEQEILVQEGALYPALHRLERRALVAEEWGLTETNREAKFYRLTPAGRRHFQEETKRWTRFSRVMRLALDSSGA